MTARPAKLKDGTWGARVVGDAHVGDVVTITTATGKSWDARITRVLWTGEGVTLCATASLDRAPGPRRRQWTGCSCGSIEEYPRESDCWSCQHDQ